jgi:hypothetical protein
MMFPPAVASTPAIIVLPAGCHSRTARPSETTSAIIDAPGISGALESEHLLSSDGDSSRHFCVNSSPHEVLSTRRLAAPFDSLTISQTRLYSFLSLNKPRYCIHRP